MAKELPRLSDGTIDGFAWPGGIRSTSLPKRTTCYADTARMRNDPKMTTGPLGRPWPRPEGDAPEDPVVDYDVNWEDPELYCDGCSERIESAYAEDEAEGKKSED